jgi:hypothetical protein
MGNTKICTKCNLELSVDEFYVNLNKKNGKRTYTSRCKKCTLLAQKEYSSKDGVKNKIKERHKEYYLRDGIKDKIKQRKKEYYSRNSVKEMVKEKQKEYYLRERENILQKRREYNSRDDVKMKRREYESSELRRENRINKQREYRYRDDVKEKNKQWQKEYYSRNEVREKLLKKRKEYNLRNKENKKKRDKEYRLRDDVKKRRNQNHKERIKTDSLYAFKERLRSNISTAFSRRGQKKFGVRTEEIVGIDFERFKAYIESKFLDGMSWENRNEWHLDHIIPISLAETREDVIRLCHYTNYQPLWAIDNMRKGNKVIISE